MTKKTATRPQQIRKVIISGFFALLIATIFAPTPARADLTIMPIRLLMEDRDRNAELTLLNSSNVTNTYRLEWGHRRMKEEGGYIPLTEPLDPLFDPNKTIRFSPRQVTIKPGQTQRIRLSVRRPADLPDGEYRGHLVLRKVARNTPRQSSGKPGLDVQMNTNVGFSIPVVVRQGAFDAGVKINDPQFIQPTKAGDNPILTLTLNRTGIHGINGTLRIYWTPVGEDERVIGTTKNINIFHEIDKRIIGVSLRENNITAGTIRITFEGQSKQRGVIYDEQSFPVGQ